MTLRFKFSELKFREAIIYAAERAEAEGDKWFGAIKLNKILYYSDFIAYRRLGSPITGATYQKLSEGPAPREMLPVRERMVRDEDVRVETRQVFNFSQQRIVPLRAPELSALSEDERAILDEVIETLWDKSAAEASEMSHRDIGWIAAASGEEIPYETAWLDPIPHSAEQELSAQLDTDPT